MTAPNPSGRAFGYLRLSPRDSDSRVGLDVQLAQVRELATRLGLELAAIYRDEDVSGRTEGADRLGLAALLEVLRPGDALLVQKRDRLGRDVCVVATIERAVAQRGCRILSAAGEGTGEDDPTAILMRRIVDAFAEYEVNLAIWRTRLALGQKKIQGQTTGTAPYGHRVGADGKTLEEDPDEARVVQRVLELHASGLGLGVIARALEAEGHPARGERWHATTVRRIIDRSAPKK